MSDLSPDLASRLAAIALGHVTREFPYAAQHVVTGPDDLALPRRQHPIFFGSFDWHSCVHGHWLLARVLRLHPDIAEADAIRAHFNEAFTPAEVAGELAYLDRPASAGFERPYGWAWLLKLAAELRVNGWAEGRPWDHVLRPLAGAFVRRFLRFLPKADYPVRAGVHSNTAFALALAHDYARIAADDGLIQMIEAKARAWYGADADCQAWEPSGDDFLSSALMEAEFMRRVLDADGFRAWFAAFLPATGEGRPATLFIPARVSDRVDGKIAHLDGLNLSRAWCWRGIASAVDAADPVRARALEAARRHLEASLPHLAADYAGEHWLASFAMLALTGD
jgi:hypothetical protein